MARSTPKQRRGRKGGAQVTMQFRQATQIKGGKGSGAQKQDWGTRDREGGREMD